MADATAMPAPNGAATPPIIQLEGICKSFGPVRANHDISLTFRRGRITALLGENGAGKSTLMNILSGHYPPDAGRILVDGHPMAFRSPKVAIEAGIGMIYQHFMLVESMTVAQNVLLGQVGAFFYKPREMRARVAALAESYGLSIDPAAKVRTLSMGEKQRVEILKLLYRQSRVLILDEPTAVLTPSETGQLFQAMRQMAAQGKAMVFISHKLPEVLDVADDIAILRQGQVVDTFSRDTMPDEHALANRMVGRDVILDVSDAASRRVPLGDEVLAVQGLSGDGLDDVALTVRQGEIVALAGVGGNGQKQLVEAVCGLRRPEKGAVRILGQEWKDFYAPSRVACWKQALAYIPEDRRGLAALPNLNMVDNVLLTTRHGFTRSLFLKRDNAADETERLVRAYNVQPGNPDALARQLSGGNLQKLVLAREFFREPRIIVAEQPTQGLDVAAIEDVWRQLLAARERAGVLLVTGDLNEAVQLADRIAVIYRGRIVGVVAHDAPDKIDTIGRLMAGLH